MKKANTFKIRTYLLLKIYTCSCLSYKEYNNSLKQLLIGGRGIKVENRAKRQENSKWALEAVSRKFSVMCMVENINEITQ